ncbi:peptide ABC transporter substrate-binding protein [Dellaglioa algida]|nr:peptide ABC transporter substrate-binding protein [Dellaglioa algida]
MKLKSVLKLSGVLALSVVVLAACGSKSSSSDSKELADKQVINWSETAELPSMDLSKATDAVSFDMLNNTNEGLYSIGKNSKVSNALATKTTISKDGMTYTFDLRDSKWSNGDDVTAQDFVYSWQRTVNPKTASQYSYLFSGIKNYDAISTGKMALSELGIKAKDKHTLVVTLDKKVPYFKLLMGFPAFYPQNQKTVEKYGSNYGTQSKYMVYNGPFTLDGWTGTNLNWKLKKNNTYWDKKAVKLTEMNFQVSKDNTTSYNLYQSKKLDMTNLSAEQAKTLSSDKDYITRKQASTFYLQYNQTNKLFQNKKIRQAISLVINRKQFVDKILGDGSTAAAGLVTTELAANPKTGTDFSKESEVKSAVSTDIPEAKKLWKAGLKEVGVSKASFSIMSEDTDKAKKTNEFLQNAIEDNLDGADVTLTNIPFKSRLARSASGDFDIVVTAWAADFSDPISFLDLFTSDNAQNAGKWKNSEFDALIKASKSTDASNPDKRWDDLVKAEKILMEDQGISPLYQMSQAQLLRSTVKGVIYNGAGVNYNFKGAYVTK